MKKILMYFVFLLLPIFLVGCDFFANGNAKSIALEEIKLSEVDKGMEVEVTVKFDALTVEKSDIQEIGIIYMKKEAEKSSEITFETMDGFFEASEIDSPIRFVIADIEESEYTTPYSIRAYFIYRNSNQEEKIVYSQTFQVADLYTLAKESAGEFAQQIIDVVEGVSNSDDYVPVTVSFDPAGGYWTSEFIRTVTPEATATATALNDQSGQSFTVISSNQTLFRTFYKIFLSYEENADAYKVVAVDPATKNVSDPSFPDFDYALAVHDSLIDPVTDIIKSYASDPNTIGKYVLFGSDINEFGYGKITASFYPSSIISDLWEDEYFNADELPVLSRYQYNFLGWTDGNETFTVFPRYKESQNVDRITYMAVWEPYSAEDFRDMMKELIPDEVNTDLELPIVYSEFYITWESSNPDIISNSGKFVRPYQGGDIITLTATLSSSTKIEEQTYEVEVKPYKSLSEGIASSYIYRSYSAVTEEFFDTLDIINCAFITAYASGSLSTSTLNNINTYIMPRAHEHGDWVTFSVAPESSWSAIASDPTLVNTFANNIVKMINNYGFDGVDIDWETPTASEATKFTAMMKVIYQKVKANNPNHIVTAAIAGGMWQPPRYDLTNSKQYLDYINMMTYGMTDSAGQYQNALYKHSSFDNQTFQAGWTLNSCSVDESVAFYKNNYNIPNSMIIVGVAFYGMRQVRSQSGSGWTQWQGVNPSVFYPDIKANYLNNSNYIEYYDEVAQVPYIIKKDGTEFLSYDNPRSILAKCDYVLDKGLAGIMYWENGADLSGDLLAAMKTGLNK